MVAAGLAAATLTASPVRAATVQTVYMNAAGDDAGDGATPATAVASLVRVQQLVAAGPADLDVEVRIHAGTYVAQGITWQTYRPGHTITFLPDDYEYGEGVGGIAALPVFQNKRASGSGRYITGSWFMACPGAAGQPLADGGTSGLRFYYLRVEYYANAALSLDGSAGSCGGGYQRSSAPGLPSARGLDGNTVFGMRFTKIGNAYTGGACDDPDFQRCGYGGIVLTESSNNRIENNHFVDLRNSEHSYIHAIYVTHKSSNELEQPLRRQPGDGRQQRADQGARRQRLQLVREQHVRRQRVRAVLAVDGPLPRRGQRGRRRVLVVPQPVRRQRPRHLPHRQQRQPAGLGDHPGRRDVQGSAGVPGAPVR
ncbi:hypothetical protein Vau01_042360 [Virgisporangium aurantiacum]|uniref:Right handed beta helix domain-containing protein n=1 Tax=Virgisporangium aurantiacum TaxID=175570 RepID=A0A8J3Z858_9ACTN|nr:hypothetical protein Vau01_042360 [Virgisporangium aurantiacum]